jgi:hypothetical protein
MRPFMGDRLRYSQYPVQGHEKDMPAATACVQPEEQ